ncbi:hypothetical protein HYALB_00010368 [Hymenoscyphus albidus]|uniref:LCCL domain-containing protein n=1 Tax=Hymenoscyphus albidus TaxID=595503 RepID=A0A9N9Q6D6_9HELO|nr:hypothetical protein HYALB_00010368 [Hymenoscyphus albidus]
MNVPIGESYGRREDEDPNVIDEEAQPLQTGSIELEDFGNDTLPYQQIQPPRSSRNLFAQTYNSFANFLKGPNPPRIQTITPWFPSIQNYPVELLDRRLPTRKRKVTALSIFCLVWVVLVGLILHKSTATGKVPGTNLPIKHIDCVKTLWLKDSDCGLDGLDCRPFNGSSLAFRCDANCAQVQVLNPHYVGAQEILYQPLVIGGPVYRGDSFICSSAIHAGISTRKNGIESIGFDSYFPLSFELEELSGFDCPQDQRWILLALSLIFTTILSVFTSSASVQFFVTFTILFAHVSMISDPPSISDLSVSVLQELFSSYAGSFLPAAFCAIVLYWICVRNTLHGLTAQFEKTLLWLGGCWLGALSNYTFEWIPIQRLRAHDLEQQSGAKVALAIIVTIILVIVFQQAYYFRLENRLLKYLALYGILILSIGICLLLPGLELRIHHYILALLLLPGTSLQTRPSLLYQGIFLGLFINGISRWGFDSVLQTPMALRGDGAFGSELPSIAEPEIFLDSTTSNITFSWALPAPNLGYDGTSILVNDVERHRTYFGESSPPNDRFTWTRPSEILEYFRFGFVSGGMWLDYTKAGIWYDNGTWIGP